MLRAAFVRLTHPKFRTTLFNSLLGTLGGLSSLAAFAPNLTADVRVLAALVALISLGSIFLAFHRARPKQVNPLEPEPPFRRYRIERCRARPHILQVNELARQVFPKVKPLPTDRYEQWLMVNPNILVCLHGPSGEIRGYFDLYPLREEFLACFLDGRLGERDIRREDVLPPEQARDAKQLYLAGLSVIEPHTYEGGKAGLILIWGLLRYLEDFYTPLVGKTIYATAVTPEGKKLLQRFQFELCRPATKKRGDFPMYRLRLTSALLEFAWNSVPDWSRQCRIEWYETDEHSLASSSA